MPQKRAFWKCEEPMERLYATYTSSSEFHPSLCVVQQAPECLSALVTDSFVCGKHVSTSIDLGSSLSYMNERTPKELLRCWICLSISRLLKCVWLWVLRLEVIGHCYVGLTLNDKVYNNVYVGVMENLCCDVLLGQDFQRQHRRVVFEYGGPKPEFIISSTSNKTCTVVAANTQCPSIFGNLMADCHPIAVQSGRYSAPGWVRVASSTWNIFRFWNTCNQRY